MRRLRLFETLLVAGLSCLGWFAAGRMHASPPDPPGPQSAVEDPDPLTTARGLSDAVVGLVEQLSPAVVQIKTLQVRDRSKRSFRTLQEGSGVIVRASGVIVTNNHVVKNGDEFRAVLSSGVRLPARLLGRDPEADLAVLQIETPGTYGALEIESKRARVGQSIFALGNPMGLGLSVTGGIVCGVGRSDLDIAVYEDFIQTDAVINPGNSGGALVDLNGRVLGISTAVGLKKNGDDGIAFAIPGSMVRKTVEDILEHGEVVRGWIGLEPHTWMDPEREEGYDGVSRVKVRRFPVDKDSPAERAGVEIGDIVLAVGDRRLVTRRDLMTAVAECAPGDTVVLDLWRAGDTLKVPVVLGKRVAEESD